MLPIVTLLGMSFGTLLGGSAIVETIFSWPGVGRLAVTSISAGLSGDSGLCCLDGNDLPADKCCSRVFVSDSGSKSQKGKECTMKKWMENLKSVCCFSQLS